MTILFPSKLNGEKWGWIETGTFCYRVAQSKFHYYFSCLEEFPLRLNKTHFIQYFLFLFGLSMKAIMLIEKQNWFHNKN